MRERGVLFLHPTDEAYGADRSLLLVAVGLHCRGWRVRIAVSDDQKPGWLTEQARAAGITVERAPLAPARRRYLSLRQMPGYVRKLITARRWIRREIEAFRPSVVVVNTSALPVGGIIGRPRGVRVVWYVHEIVVDPILASWMFRLVPLLTSDLILTVSDAARRHITPFRIRRARVVALWNAVEPRPAVERTPVQPPMVAFVGRLNRWKGYEVLVEAAALLADELPDVRFTIAGAPPMGEEWRTEALLRHIERLNLRDRFDLPGFVEDGWSVFARSTIVVVPSVWPEPFGLVTLEAMASGTAVVATAHGGSMEIIESGKSGLLIPPGDPWALAGAVRRLLLDDELRERLAASGRRRVEQVFSPDRLQDKLDVLLTGMLADDGRPMRRPARSGT
jgi:glycosyltransferase involved in cell wall biosynthesis